MSYWLSGIEIGTFGPIVDIFYKAQWFSHVRYLPNPPLFKTQTQKPDCKPLAERLTWYLKSKRLSSPLSNKVQISPTAINTLSEKYAVWAEVFNHEIIWLYLALWFSPVNLTLRIQTPALGCFSDRSCFSKQESLEIPLGLSVSWHPCAMGLKFMIGGSPDL